MNILSLNTWRGKLEEEITTFILKYKQSVDIFCFQEVDPPMQAICRQLLQGYAEFDEYKFVAVKDDFNQSTFVRENIEVVSLGTVLKNVPNTGLGLWIKIRVGGETLTVCNYHGMARPGSKLDTPERLFASKELIHFFNQEIGSRVIIGDFNLLDTVESISMFEQHGYVDLIKKYGVTNTRNRYAWERHPDKIQYFADFAFVSDDLKEKSFTVLPDEVSDHAALLLEL